MLSNSDLDFLFDGHHHGIADAVIAAAPSIAASGDARSIAAAMAGNNDLYRFFTDADAVDVRAICLVREALAYHSPLADSIFAVHGLGSYPLALSGSPVQREWLAAHRRGERIGAFALTEPEAGSDVASMRTVARADGDSFVLDGEKTLISNVGLASHYVVFANADPDRGKSGISAFVVEAGSEGLVEEPFEVAYDHPIGTLRFDGCRIPHGALLGEVGSGFATAMSTLDTFRVSVGAAAVGMARRALDEAIGHVRGRVQFGKPLGAQPVVRSMLADMATDLDAARLLVYRAALHKDQGREVGAEVAMAKLYSTEAAQRIIDGAVQLFGGRGVRSGEVVEALYRAIRPLRIYEGTSEIQRLIIGRSLVSERNP